MKSFKGNPVKPANRLNVIISEIGRRKEIVHKDVAVGGEKCGAGQLSYNESISRPITVESIRDLGPAKVLQTSKGPEFSDIKSRNRNQKDLTAINWAWEQKTQDRKEDRLLNNRISNQNKTSTTSNVTDNNSTNTNTHEIPKSPFRSRSISRTSSIFVKVKSKDDIRERPRSVSRHNTVIKVRPEEVPVGQRYEDYFKIKKKEETEFGKKPRWFTPRLTYYIRE